VICKQSPESTYNMARAFHQLSLFYLANPLYEKVIASNTDLRMEAAYNLSLIYRTSGSEELARKILYDNIVI